MDITIQTAGVVIGLVFWLAVFALLFSWINAQVKAYYSPKPYYSRRPKSQESSIWNKKRAFDDLYDTNPATGLPMVGGCDVGGNLYGDSDH